MKLIQQSADIWEQPEGEVGIYKQVERAARLCYMSTDKITEDSYKRFIDMLSTKGHNSPLEHGTVYLAFFEPWSARKSFEVQKYIENPYSRVSGDVYDRDDYQPEERQYSTAYVTTNYRALLENGWLNDLKYLCEPTEYHEKRISVHMVTSIGVSRELNRHRVNSMAEQSTRYCNFSKDKFGNEITFIIPDWVNTKSPNVNQEGPSVADMEWSTAMLNAEASYMNLLKMGWKPEQARSVLPLDTKTELVHTAFLSDWMHFFELRTSPAAHPMMRDLANKIKQEFIKNNIIKDEK
jgi:thymidylate synthase (FAD)